jgi:heme-degrading monooxygenase HmoA
MVARVTLAEIDSVRTSVDTAVRLFEESVVPELREQDGYEGCYVLTTPAGKAVVLTFWRDEHAAYESVLSGSYGAQVDKFVTFIKSAPERDTYDVALGDSPVAAG